MLDNFILWRECKLSIPFSFKNLFRYPPTIYVTSFWCSIGTVSCPLFSPSIFWDIRANVWHFSPSFDEFDLLYLKKMTIPVFVLRYLTSNTALKFDICGKQTAPKKAHGRQDWPSSHKYLPTFCYIFVKYLSTSHIGV